MDSTSHPFVIDADAEGSAKETAILLVGTAVEFDLDPSVDIQRITRPYPGFRITEALAQALGDDTDPEPGDHDEDGFPLDGGPYERSKPEDWLALSDEGKRAYVYDGAPEPDLSGAKQSLAPEHDIHGEPTAVAYQDWDYADLKAAVKTRTLDVEDQKAETLIAALVAADKAEAADQADADSDSDDQTA